MDKINSQLLIHNLFDNAALKYPAKVALQIKKGEGWQKVTYEEVGALSKRIGAYLIKEGFSKGDFVGLILENRPEWAAIYFGIMYAGMSCVPLDPQLSHEEIENLIADCGSRILFISYNIFLEKNIHKLKSRLNKIIILDLDIEEDNLLGFSQIKSVSSENILWPQVSSQDIASLIYTSGTTGKPKGVMLTHKNICSNFMSIKKINLMLPSDNFLSILPLYHTYAFMVTLLAPLFLGAKVTYCASFKPGDLTQIIKEAEVTILVGVPQLFSLIHKSIFDKLKKIPFFIKPLLLPVIKLKIKRHFGKNLRLLMSGGARLELKVASDLSRLGFKLIEGYGLTETSPVVTFNPPWKVKFGSVGKHLPDVEIKIFNPDKSGIGEVLIKGPNVMLGYYKRPDLTEEVIKEGWFHSGDLGYKDKEGYLYLVGRKKDVIVLGSGKNIYPDELQDYYGATPYIKEICVLSKTEEKFGRIQDLVYAIIVPDLEYFRQKGEKNIREKIRWELDNLAKGLPSYKHIMGFTITKEELPRTRLKKIKRYEIAQKYFKVQLSPQVVKETIFSEEDLRILDTDVAKKIMRYLCSELKKPVYLDSHLEIDLGIDSLSRVELGLGLEALLSMKIPDELIDSVSTVKEVIANIQDIINKPKLKPNPCAQGLGEPKEEKTWGEILKKSPSDVIIKQINIEAGLLDKILTIIFKNGFLFIFKVFWFLRIEGRGFLPSSGPYILCPNHASYLDGFFIFVSLPFKDAINTFFLGYAKIFEHPLVNWATKLGRFIPIDPGTHLTEAMQATSYVLKYKKAICIFPEGGRSINEQVGEFKKGIGILTKELDVPVIPVYIQGSHRSWPRGNRFPRLYPIKVIFGRPLHWEKLGGDYETIAQRLREEVLKLVHKNANL